MGPEGTLKNWQSLPMIVSSYCVMAPLRHRVSRLLGRRPKSLRSPDELDRLLDDYLGTTAFFDVVQGLVPRPGSKARSKNAA